MPDSASAPVSDLALDLALDLVLESVSESAPAQGPTPPGNHIPGRRSPPAPALYGNSYNTFSFSSRYSPARRTDRRILRSLPAARRSFHNMSYVFSLFHSICGLPDRFRTPGRLFYHWKKEDRRKGRFFCSTFRQDSALRPHLRPHRHPPLCLCFPQP